MRKNNRKENTTKKRKRRKKRYILRLFIAIVLCIGVYCTLHIDKFDVDGIAVSGNKEVSDETILKLSELEVGENIFDIGSWFVERKIKKNLYIKDVNIKKHFPNHVEIIIKERDGKAQFKMKNQYVITDNDGMVLEISDVKRKVTLVSGVEVTKARLEKTVKVKDSDRNDYNKAVAIIKAAEEGDLYFKSIEIKKDKVNANVYGRLMCNGKYDNFMNAIKKETLKAVIFDLYQKDRKKGTISIGDNDYCSFSPEK